MQRYHRRVGSCAKSEKGPNSTTLIIHLHRACSHRGHRLKAVATAPLLQLAAEAREQVGVDVANVLRLAFRLPRLA